MTAIGDRRLTSATPHVVNSIYHGKVKPIYHLTDRHHCPLVVLIRPFCALIRAIACRGLSSHPWVLLSIIGCGSSPPFDVHSGVSFLPPPWSSHSSMLSETLMKSWISMTWAGIRIETKFDSLARAAADATKEAFISSREPAARKPGFAGPS